MSNESTTFFVTHFIYEPPAEEGFTKLPYMTATGASLRKKLYYMGFGTHRSFDEDYLEAKIASGSLVKLPSAHAITKDKGIWIDKNKNVYLADRLDPFGEKIQIYSYDFAEEASMQAAGNGSKNVQMTKSKRKSLEMYRKMLFRKNEGGVSQKLKVYDFASTPSE